jgi:hypothetical protein
MTKARLEDEADSEEIEGWFVVLGLHAKEAALSEQRATARAALKR